MKYSSWSRLHGRLSGLRTSRPRLQGTLVSLIGGYWDITPALLEFNNRQHGPHAWRPISSRYRSQHPLSTMHSHCSALFSRHLPFIPPLSSTSGARLDFHFAYLLVFKSQVYFCRTCSKRAKTRCQTCSSGTRWVVPALFIAI